MVCHNRYHSMSELFPLKPLNLHSSSCGRWRTIIYHSGTFWLQLQASSQRVSFSNQFRNVFGPWINFCTAVGHSWDRIPCWGTEGHRQARHHQNGHGSQKDGWSLQEWTIKVKSYFLLHHFFTTHWRQRTASPYAPWFRDRWVPSSSARSRSPLRRCGPRSAWDFRPGTCGSTGGSVRSRLSPGWRRGRKGSSANRGSSNCHLRRVF